MYWRKQLITITVALLIAIGTAVVHPAVSFAQEKGLESLKQTGQAFRQVAKKVSPAVVFIKVEKEVSTSSVRRRSFNSPIKLPKNVVRKSARALVS